MPEGFSNINDLVVRITTETDGFKNGLTQAADQLSNFTSTGGNILRGFDSRVVGPIAGNIAGLAAKMNLWILAADQTIGIVGNLVGKMEEVAKAAGREEEFGKVKDEWTKLQETASSIVPNYTRALAQMMVAAIDAKEASDGAAQGEIARASGMDTARAAQERSTVAVRAAADGLTRLKAEQASMADAQAMRASESIAFAGELQAAIDELQRAGTTGGVGKVIGPDDAGMIRAAVGELNALAGGIGALKPKAEEAQSTLQRLFSVAKDVVIGVRQGIDTLNAPQDRAMDTLKKDIDALNKALAIAEVQGKTTGDAMVALGATGRLLDFGLFLPSIDQFIIKATSARDRLKEIYDAKVEAERTRIGEPADKIISDIGREVRGLEQKAEAVGKVDGALARLNSEQRVANMLADKGIELTPFEIEKLKEKQDAIEKATNALRRAERDAKAGETKDSTLESLAREADALKEKAANLDLAAGTTARLAAEQRTLSALERAGITITDDLRLKVRQHGIEIENATNAINAHTAAKRAGQQMASQLGAIDQEIARLQATTAALYDQTEAARVAARARQELARASAQGRQLELDDIAALGEKVRQLEAVRTAAERARLDMANLKAHADVVTRGLEQGFAQWTSGAELNVKKMVASMLAEFAKLAFKQAMLPLNNMLTSSLGSIFGSGIGSWTTSVIPAFAEGGYMPPGQLSMVGERGPELMISGTGGTVIPADKTRQIMGGAAPINISINPVIDARGAYPESIEQIRAAVSEMTATLPSRIVAVVADAKDRNVLT